MSSRTGGVGAREGWEQGARRDLRQALLGAVADAAPVCSFGEVVPETLVNTTEFLFFSEALQFDHKQMQQQ